MTYQAHAKKKIVYEPDWASKDALNLAHIQVNKVHICLSESKLDCRVVSVNCFHLRRKLSQVSNHSGMIQEIIFFLSLVRISLFDIEEIHVLWSLTHASFPAAYLNFLLIIPSSIETPFETAYWWRDTVLICPLESIPSLRASCL